MHDPNHDSQGNLLPAADLPEAGQQLSKEQKRKLMEQQVSKLLASFNRKQRRAFASKFQKTKNFEAAIGEAIRLGWRGQFIAPK